MATFLHRFYASLRDFRKAGAGNVVITFAVAIVPIMGSVGAAVDFSRVSAVRTAMQASVDATALGMSKLASATYGNGGSTGQAALDAAAADYFNAIFTKSNNVSPPTVTTAYSTANGLTLTVNSTATIPTTFLSMLSWVGMPKSFTIGATSTVTWGNTRLRVALVLDNTGSMAASGKLTALQTATKNLIDQLHNAATNDGDVYISIIPFVKDVSVDPVSNYTATWIDWTDWDVANGTCSKSYSTKNKCLLNGGTWTPKNHNTWNGCLTDRGPSPPTTPPASSATAYDENVAAAVPGTPSSLYPAEQYGSCPLNMKGLSYDWTAMKNMVDLMVANGSTNQPIGLVWGWTSLVGGGPLTAPALDNTLKYKHVIILLSDGLNTQDRWYGNGSTTSTQVDSRMYDNSGAGTCKNIKDTKIQDANIDIYTVQVDTDGAPTSLLLQNCATDSDHFFLLTSADEIITTFQQIGTKLSELRVAK